uniref:Girdin-like n=1 Tax=Elaeis guineensis var. tenera TaxID=51953 RepID=A0A8N4F0F2_ELAGV|nr:girdin-like [Elaeis guineensis]
MAQLNAKAINVLYCSLNVHKFNRISTCISAKEIWDKLDVTHEGTSQVKESKINLLAHKYEIFKIEPHESISDMFTRFTNIINVSNGLGKTYTNHELVCKVLRSLPKAWEAKVTTIQEAKDLSKLALEELIGSLMTYELNMNQNIEEEKMKKRTLAFKSSAIEENSSDSVEDLEDDEEMAVITKRFMRFMRKKKKFEPRRGKGKKNQLRKYRNDYPLLKKSSKKLRKKVILTDWSSSENSNSQEESSSCEEETNLCLMAHNEEVISIQSNDFTFDELHDAFYELFNDFKRLSKRNKELKKENQNLSKDKDRFEEDKKELQTK